MGKKVKILTYGCAMNKADSEFMVGLLEKEGFTMENGDADIIVVNTCAVKTPTERKILRKLKELEKRGERVLVTGCLPASQPEISKEFKKFSFLGINISDVVDGIKSIDRGEKFVKISSEKRENVDLKVKARGNLIREIIPIAQGCVGNCSYCLVKEARGGVLKSMPSQDIVKGIHSAVREGVKEIWLTAQDTGAYGLDIGEENLPSLLREVSKIPGNFFIRVGMMNPDHAKKFLDELILAYKSEKIYKFLHIPVQSGDDEVLKMMRRHYEVEDFRRLVKKFRKEIPDITISTDVIVGFPTESEEQFLDSVELIKEVKPDVLNISRYWSRPGTFSAKRMRELPGRETKRRSRIMSELFKKIGFERNEKWVGWEGEVLISEYGKKSQGYCARNFAYKPIILNVGGRKNLLGEFVKVKIKSASYYDLRGEVI